MAASYRVFGMSQSFFTRKLEGALAYKRIPYRLVRFAGARADAHAAGWPGGVPVVQTPEGEWAWDTTDLLHHLELRYPEPGGGPAPLMFTGIQVLSPRIFEYIPRGRFSHTTNEAYPAAIAAGELVLGHVAAGVWRELSTLDLGPGDVTLVIELYGLGEPAEIDVPGAGDATPLDDL